LVLICDLTMLKIWWAKIPTIGKCGFMFPPPLKKTFDFFGTHLVVFRTQYFFNDNFFCWFTCAISLLKNIHASIFINYLFYTSNFKFWFDVNDGNIQKHMI
jgi:hypothetical protein